MKCLSASSSTPFNLQLLLICPDDRTQAGKRDPSRLNLNEAWGQMTQRGARMKESLASYCARDAVTKGDLIAGHDPVLACDNGGRGALLALLG